MSSDDRETTEDGCSELNIMPGTTVSVPDVAPAWYQYIYCAVCLEVQRELEEAKKQVELAITMVDGTAVCEEHRRRVKGYDNAVRGARRFLQRENGTYQPRERRP